MGMYDSIMFNCGKCGKEMIIQTKILGSCLLTTFVVGEKLRPKEDEKPLYFSNTVFNEHFNDCIFKVKEKCPKCGKLNLIRIEGGRLKEVINNKNEEILVELGSLDVVKEEPWGNYKRARAN